MPEADAAARAATIEAELQTSIDEAKADVAKEAQSDEEKRVHEERLSNLERQLADVRTTQASAPAVPAVPETPAAPAPDPDAEWRTNIERRLDDIASAVRNPVDAAGDAAAAVVDTATDAAGDAAEIVESVPVRTHGMFRKVFGGRD